MIRATLKFMLRGPAHAIATTALLAFIPLVNMVVTPLCMFIVISRGVVLGAIALAIAATVEVAAGQAYLAYSSGTVLEFELPVIEVLLRFVAPLLMAALVRQYRRIDWAMIGAWVAMLLVVVLVQLFYTMPTATAVIQYANCIYGCAPDAALLAVPDEIRGYWLELISVAINGWAALIYLGSTICLYLACWLEKIAERSFALEDGLWSWRLPNIIVVLAMILGVAAGLGTWLPLWVVAVGWLAVALLGILGVVIMVSLCQQYQKSWLWITLVLVAMLIGVLPSILVCVVVAVLDALFDFRQLAQSH